jgi:hypothetical protein
MAQKQDPQFELRRNKVVENHLCEASAGPFRQEFPDRFFGEP